MNASEVNIDVSGVPVELQSHAEEQIRYLVEVVAEVSEQMGFPFLLKLVLVTGSYQDDVNWFLQERAGPTGYVAKRESLQALARTLWIRSDDGELSFVNVIDANQGSPWSLNDPDCLITVLHELLHVPYEARRLEMLGEDEYTAGNSTAERMLSRDANLLIDEFAVDRTVDALLPLFAKDGDGQPMSLRGVKEALGEDWVQHLLAELDRMPQIIDHRVQRVLTGQEDVQFLADTVIPYVTDLLTLVAHTASLYMGTDQWDRNMDFIRQTEASERFLEDHLTLILGQLDDSQLPLSESVQMVANALEAIFQNCGLNFPKCSEGLYIVASPPSR